MLPQKKVTPSGMWVSEDGEIKLANIDRMPIHHKATEKRKVTRKIKSPKEGRPLIRSKTYIKLKRDGSKAELQNIPVRPTTPKYLKDCYDYDKSSSSEENVSDDDKDKKPKKPLELSQRVYLTACERSGIPSRRRLLKGLVEESLDICNLSLASNDVRALSLALTTNMCVSSLDLSGNNVGRDGVESLVQMLDENMTISELNLSNTNIGLYEITLLTELLSENLRITSFEAAGNNLDDECAKCFAEALKIRCHLNLQFNRKLKKLNLSHNSFQETGGQILAKIIESNDSILELDMSWNHIRLVGAIAWGDTLYKNEELRHLDLSWNGFGDDGAAAIGEALEENKYLQTLDLSNNRIGFDGCKAFAKALNVNTSLQSLALSKNPITTQGAMELLNAIKENEKSKLHLLCLEGIQVTHETDDVTEEIRERAEDFELRHGGYVISPDTLAFKPVIKPDKKCRSSKS